MIWPLEMNADSLEVQTGPPRETLIERFLLIFSTGFSEIKRKGTVTRLYFEIKNFEKDKERYIEALGVRAWEAHVHHPDLAGIIVNLKELQIEMNRLKTQFGEHDTQIRDIESLKAELTQKFNQELDRVDQQIVPHRQRIETINAEKEDNKVQTEELRTKQDHLSQQVRIHQQSIQELDLGDDADKTSKIQVEQDAIHAVYRERSEVDCKIPFLLSQMEKLKISLANERSGIEKLEEEKDACKRDYEQRIRDYNQQIHQLEERKRQSSRQMEHFRRDMEPFLFDLGKKVEQLRLEQDLFRENYDQLDGFNREIETRRKQILEAESLSRAMDRAAWTKFLVFSGSMLVLVVSAVFLLLH
jgi:chromosome segregation ATPase